MSQNDFAVLVMEGDKLNEFGTKDHNSARVHFTTHQRLQLVCRDRHFSTVSRYYYRDQPRHVRIWMRFAPGRSRHRRSRRLRFYLHRPLRQKSDNVVPYLQALVNRSTLVLIAPSSMCLILRPRQVYQKGRRLTRWHKRQRTQRSLLLIYGLLQEQGLSFETRSLDGSDNGSIREAPRREAHHDHDAPVDVNLYREYLIEFGLHATVNPEYVTAFFQSEFGQSCLLGGSRSMTLANLNAPTIKAISVPLPSIELQRQFAERIMDIQSIVAQQDRMANAAEQLADGLMAKMFS